MAANAESNDERWMHEAIGEALKAQAAGEVPVGAIVVLNDEIVGRGGNRNLIDLDPTAHAEMVALREAGRRVGNHRLINCDLYCTIEPCSMCAGAMVHARIRKLIYGADDPKAGAAGSVLAVLNHPKLNHEVVIVRGVLAARCSDMVRSFFRAKRSAEGG